MVSIVPIDLSGTKRNDTVDNPSRSLVNAACCSGRTKLGLRVTRHNTFVWVSAIDFSSSSMTYAALSANSFTYCSQKDLRNAWMKSCSFTHQQVELKAF